MRNRPLAGVRVVVTRAAHQAAGLVAKLETAGAAVARLPLLELVPPADPRPLERAAGELALYDWLVFTSANAVDAFLPRTGGALPERLRVAVVGGATARALEAYGIEAPVVAPTPRAEGLVDALGPRARRQRLLLPQAADARRTLAAGLATAGGEVVTVVAYAKRCPPQAAAAAHDLFQSGPLGWVTFTSPSTVENFRSLFATDWPKQRSSLEAVSIGGVTSEALRRAGVEPAAEASEASDDGLVDAVIQRHGRADG